MRQPIAAGFYPFGKRELEEAVKSYLVSDKSIDALGIIVPHAGYAFSGSVAGATFAAAKTGKRNFVLMGPNHTGYGQAIASSNDDWKTPLGIVKTKEIQLPVDETAHKYEHSIEVQLPFLQMTYRDFTITPVCLQQLEFLDIEELSKNFENDSFFVASSDFTHFGPNYDYEPVKGNIREKLDYVKKTDYRLIDLICGLKAEKFYSEVTENDYTVCGFVPITLLMLVMKRLGAKKGELIKYSTSYAVAPGSSFVSYAGIAFS